MAVNKNFVVKNGLEVDTNTLFVDSANNRVAIGTTVPTAALDVRGKILSDSQVESFVGKFVGIVTAGAVGVTTMTTFSAHIRSVTLNLFRIERALRQMWATTCSSNRLMISSLCSAIPRSCINGSTFSLASNLRKGISCCTSKQNCAS